MTTRSRGLVPGAGVFKGHPGHETIQQIHGVDPVFAAIFVAERDEHRNVSVESVRLR